jgi:hypothetical protein
MLVDLDYANCHLVGLPGQQSLVCERIYCLARLVPGDLQAGRAAPPHLCLSGCTSARAQLRPDRVTVQRRVEPRTL